MNGGNELTVRERVAAAPTLAWTFALAGLMAAVMAVAVATAIRDVAVALLAGIGFFVVAEMGLVVANAVSPQLPPGLSAEERRQVVRCVSRGETPHDPRLAQAVIAYAGNVHRRSFTDARMRWVLVAGAAVFVVLAIADLIAGRPLLALARIALLALFASGLPAERRRLERAATAQAAARGMLKHG